MNGIQQYKCGSKGGVHAYHVFQKCYDATFELIRRGFAHDIATTHFQKALFEVSNSTKDSVKSSRFASVCIPPEVYGRIFTVRWTTVLTETALNDMLLSISNSFFNPREDAVKVYSGSWKQRLEKYMYWWLIRRQLWKPYNSIDPKNFKFPPTIRHVQDPEYKQVCAEWKLHFVQPTTSAIAGLQQVLKIVVNLLKVGCDPNGSWQILRHYSALVYVGIRCQRKEKEELDVPDQYFEDYSVAAMALMNDAQKAGKLVPYVASSDHEFEIMYKFIYERLATFSAWGVADMTFGSNMVVKNLMVFVNQSVHREMGDLGTVLRTYGIHPAVRTEGGGEGPDCKSKNNNAKGQKCNTKAGYCFWKHDQKKYEVKNLLENCCQDTVCTNAVRILPTRTSYAECCRDCNQFQCKPKFKNKPALKIPHVSKDHPQVIHIYI